MTSNNTCLHFKFGYCRYQSTCRLNHVREVCQVQSCDIKECDKRHPRICRYWHDYGRCKFSEYCAYLHEPTRCGSMRNVQEDCVKKLVATVDTLENQCQAYQSKVDILETQVEDMKLNFTVYMQKHNTGTDTADGTIESLVETVDLHKLKFEVFNEEFHAYSLAVDEIEIKLAELENEVSYRLHPSPTPTVSSSDNRLLRKKGDQSICNPPTPPQSSKKLPP